MIFLILITYFFLASTFTIGQATLHYASPVFFVAVRMIWAGLMLLGYQYFFNRKQFVFNKRILPAYIALMFLHIYIPYISEFWALQYISGAKTALIYNIAPFVTAIFAYLWFKEKLNTKKFIGLLIGFFGLIPVLTAHNPLEGSIGSSFLSWPEIAIIVSTISACAAWIIIKREVDRGISTVMLNGIAMLSGGVLAMITSTFVDTWNPIPVTNISMFLGLTFLIIIAGNILSYTLYGWLLQHHSATLLSFCGFTTPLFAAILQWIFLGEGVPWQFYVSTLIVSFGLYLFYQEELKKLKPSEY